MKGFFSGLFGYNGGDKIRVTNIFFFGDLSNDDNDGLWWLLIRWPSRNKFQNVVDRWSKQQKQQQQQLLCAWLFLCVVMAAAKKKKKLFYQNQTDDTDIWCWLIDGW